MIRNIVSVILSSNKFYQAVGVLITIAAIFNYLLFPLCPLLGEPIFISENAMSPTNPKPSFQLNTIDSQYNALSRLSSYSHEKTLEYILDTFVKANINPEWNNFTVFNATGSLTGHNLYGILRAKRTDPGECNIITFNNYLSSKDGNGKLEIAFALAFLEMFIQKHDQIHYLSRDIIFLSYDGRFKNYGTAVTAFLEDYYHGKTPMFSRCGAIRQGISIEINDDSFNKIAFYHSGFNFRLPDHDLTVAAIKMLNGWAKGLWTMDEKISFEYPLQGLLADHYYPIASTVFKSALGQVLPPMDFTKTLSSFKNYVAERPHDAHSYLMEYGIPALTFKGYKCKTCPKQTQGEMVVALGQTIEAVNRANMVLQEQLHAGSHHYVMFGSDSFMMLGRIVILLLPIPCWVIIAAMIKYHEQKGDRNYRKVVASQLRLLVPIPFMLKAHEILPWMIKPFLGHELEFCIDPTISDANSSYLSYLTYIFLGFSLALYIISGFGTPGAVRAMLPHREFGPYKKENYASLRIFHALWVGAGAIITSLLNAGTGLLAAFFVVPVLHFVRPFQILNIKNSTYYLAVFGWLLGIGYLINQVLVYSGFSLFGLMKHILLSHWCHGSDVFRFVVLNFIPCLLFLKETLFFRGE